MLSDHSIMASARGGQYQRRNGEESPYFSLIMDIMSQMSSFLCLLSPIRYLVIQN
jgi:hypothetical protein